MNPGGPKSGSGTAHSVSDVIEEDTDALLQSLADPKFGSRKQDILKKLVRVWSRRNNRQAHYFYPGIQS